MSTIGSNATSDAWSAECETRLSRFEQLWQTQVPSLDEIARVAADCQDLEQRRDLLGELIKIDLEYRWRKTEGKLENTAYEATVENYFRLFPELAHDDDLTLELAAEEYRARHRWGDAPTREVYARRFAALASGLTRRFAQIDQELASDNLPDWKGLLSDSTMGHQASERPTVAPRASQSSTRHKHEFLWRIKPFSELPEPIVKALAAAMQERDFAPGERLVQQGAEAVSLIVVTEGQVEVSILDSEGRQRVIDCAGRGTLLGEMALVSNQPHSANVTAVTAVQALVLPVKSLHRIARQFPPLGAGFADLAATRLGRHEVDVLYDKSVSGYCIKRRLGHGAMAVVYEAEEELTGRRVALKMMRHQLAYDHVAVKRFQHEAQTMAALHHANILRVHGCFAAHNTSFIVMELCEGPALSRFIERSPPLVESQIWPMLGQLAAALAHAHGHGVLHRDLKPGNVLVQWDGNLKLSDFGLARSFLSNGLTVQGEILGTPRYMPPEQLIGTNVDERADIYALGCIAFELLMGKPLFQEPDVTRLLGLQLNWSLEQALAQSDSKNPAGCRPLSPEMRGFLAQSLAIDRAQRTLNLAEIAQRAAPIDPELLLVTGMRP